MVSVTEILRRFQAELPVPVAAELRRLRAENAIIVQVGDAHIDRYVRGSELAGQSLVPRRIAGLSPRLPGSAASRRWV